MKITPGLDGPTIELQVGKRSLRWVNISVDLEDSTVNASASGDMTIAYAREFARAILLAADIAAGDIVIGEPKQH